MDRFEGVNERNGIGKQGLEGRMLLEFCDQKDLCVSNTRFKKKEKRKVIYSLGDNETEIDFALVEKESIKFLKNVKVIPWELQHRLVVVDVKKENLFRRMKMKRTCNGGCRNKKKTRKRYKDKVKELVNKEERICEVHLRMGF